GRGGRGRMFWSVSSLDVIVVTRPPGATIPVAVLGSAVARSHVSARSDTGPIPGMDVVISTAFGGRIVTTSLPRGAIAYLHPSPSDGGAGGCRSVRTARDCGRIRAEPIGSHWRVWGNPRPRRRR